MTRILILTQGPLAKELVCAAHTILGQELSIATATLDWSDDFEEASRKARQAIAEFDPDDDILILTDMYGGTPYNVAASLRQQGKIEIVTGVNLPMVVRLGCRAGTEMSLGRLAEWIETKGRRSICRAGTGRASLDPPASRDADSADDRA